MGFIYDDLKARLKVLNPVLSDWDSTKFDNAVAPATKIGITQMNATYIDAQDPFVKKSTLPATAPSSGTKIVATTVEDIFEIALAADAKKVADDVITIYNPATGDYQEVPRIEQSAIVIGTTTFAFYEVNGNIVLYIKDSSEFTTIPFKLQYDYWRTLTIPAIGSDPLDIKDQDFDSLAGIVLSYLPVS